VDWRAGNVAAEVDSPRGTFLVLNETRSVGWRAAVDGAATPIYPVNEAFQGVLVPAGRHVVRWRFASPGFFAGFLGTAVGLALIVAAPWWTRRRKRGPDAP
jgi:uncharacterized membrane protein YfhO